MTAAELVEVSALPDEAIAVAQPGMPAEAFVDALSRAGHLPQSVRALAHALPPREVIAWAADYIRTAAAPQRPPEKAAFELVERWIADGDDDHRRAAFEHAEQRIRYAIRRPRPRGFSQRRKRHSPARARGPPGAAFSRQGCSRRDRACRRFERTGKSAREIPRGPFRRDQTRSRVEALVIRSTGILRIRNLL